MSAPKGSLLPLRLSGRVPEEADVDLILIEGPGMSPAHRWAIASARWATILDETGSKVNIFSYEYNMSLDAGFEFEVLSNEGHTLLDALARHQESTSMRPVLLASHSLGGFILKQALCVASAQRQIHAKLLNSVLALMFLGGLHGPSDALEQTSRELASRSVMILRSVRNSIPKQVFTRLGCDGWSLADICALFDEIGLQVKILSIYETEVTRFQSSASRWKRFFTRPVTVKLTDQHSCMRITSRQMSLEIPGNHAQLPLFTGEEDRERGGVKEWLRSILGNEDYMDNVRRRMNPPSPAPTSTSMGSFDAARRALSESGLHIPRRPDLQESNDVTAGSSLEKDWKLVPIITAFASKRPLAKLPCFMMGAFGKNKQFYGRGEILDTLDSVLLPRDVSDSFASSDFSQKHAVLCGIGGIGKTSIAIEYAFSRKDKFDAVFWIRADEPEKLEQDFGRIAIELGLLDASEVSNTFICRELAKNWLQDPRKVVDGDNDIIGQMEANWLIVFDNADSPALLQDYWPLSSNGSILVTSRDPNARKNPAIAKKFIDVEPFSDHDAQKLLQLLARKDTIDDVPIEVAKKLGGLPLVISQMAAIVLDHYLSYPEFLLQYEDESERIGLFALDVETRRPEARGNVATIWAIEQLEPNPRCILNICAILDPDCIQDRLFTYDPTTLSTVPGMEVFPTTKLGYLAARAELIKRSLISRNHETGDFRIHRVLQSTVRLKMTPETTLTNFLAAVHVTLAAWGETPLVKRHDRNLAKSREGFFPHALALRNFFTKYYKDQNPSGILQLAKLMNESGWYQHERSNSQDSKQTFQIALDICNQNPGEESAQVLSDIHYGLAAAANETNDAKKCLFHTQKLLELRREVFRETGKEDIRLAIAYNEIAIAWVMNREYEKAIEQFGASIDVYRRLPDYWTAMDTNPRTNLGFTYWVMGDLKKGRQILLSLLKDRVAKFGQNDKESYRTGRVYHGLGNIAYDEGMLDESERYHQSALKQYQEMLGNNHHKTADLCHRVAKHCMRRNDTNNARTLIDQALRVYGLNEDVYLPELARTTFLKAKLEMQIGNEVEATNKLKVAAGMLARVIPPPEMKPLHSLTEADFDATLTFYSR